MTHHHNSTDNTVLYVNGVIVVGIICLWATFGSAGLAMLKAWWLQ